jgi:hypothetical protein
MLAQEKGKNQWAIRLFLNQLMIIAQLQLLLVLSCHGLQHTSATIQATPRGKVFHFETLISTYIDY